MYNSSNVNETHVLVLKEERGRLVKDTIPIEDCSYICTEIENAAKNPNMTVLDVQTIFNQEFQCIRNYYPYLYPYGYSNSYIDFARKPKQYTYEKYQEKLNKGIEKCKDEKEKERIIRRNQDCLKSNFKIDSIRYIHQQMMYEAFQKAENDLSVKMYSREAIGWKGFTYEITNDIDICVHTNFGYGYVSYFNLTVSYKDIVIAPHSNLVKYYRTRMVDIIQCTRMYCASKDNWYPAFDFVKDFVNQSLSNPELFVKTYIMNEVDLLMSGLRNIMVNPQGVIDKFKRQMNNLPNEYHRLRFIEPMSDEEKECYVLFPKEMPIVFKSEKLIGAMEMLEKLKELTAIYAKISDYINEIIGMVSQLKPEVDKTIVTLETEIEMMTLDYEQYKDLESEKNDLEELKEQINNQIEQIIQHNQSKNNDDVQIFADLDSLKKQLDDIEKQVKDIQKRKNKIEKKYRIDKDDCDSFYDLIWNRKELVNRLSSFIQEYNQCVETFDNVG